MAYFIVIGTNNDVRNVVDEVKKSHLQHNVVTSGCIISQEDGMYYHWDVYNESGHRTQENNESVELSDALTNQISQFKTLLPNDAIPNVFIVSKCFDQEECETLQMVCEELYHIGGAMLSGLQIDIVLLGYDVNKPGDVTIRPHWKMLESIKGLGVSGRFRTNILYINNMDYMGAATNVDSRILSRFLCNWSKMVSAGTYDPKSTVLSSVYSIGLSEYQYDFQDLKVFFELAAEEKLLDRTLNNDFSPSTKELVDCNYFSKINLELPWLDGLKKIQMLWCGYCSTPWNPSKPLTDNFYSVSKQEHVIATYLNSFLKLYIEEEKREILELSEAISRLEIEREGCVNTINSLETLPDDDESKSEQIKEAQTKIKKIGSIIEENNRKIDTHKLNIERNTFIDANDFCEKYGSMERITEDDETLYAEKMDNVKSLIQYVMSEEGIRIMRESIDRAQPSDILHFPELYPKDDIQNVGHLIERTTVAQPTQSAEKSVLPNDNVGDDRSGCLFSILNLFKKKKTEDLKPIYSNSRPTAEDLSPTSPTFDITSLRNEMGSAVKTLRKAQEVHDWWRKLCQMIELDENRLVECRLLMDGEKDLTGKYLPGKEGYHPLWNRKSISLIDMDKVREFRDENSFYRGILDGFLLRWFDSSIKLDERMPMLELIKHQIIDPLFSKYHTLQWDNTNPFVDEAITNTDIHTIIEHNIQQSKPFVEYVRIQENNIADSVNMSFFFNNPNISTDPTQFRNLYNVNTITPVFLKDFVNSLCVVQVMDIPNHIDALKDFKPKRETGLSRLQIDIKNEAVSIIREAETIEDKARAIYNWLCDNISYDTTKQIFDAETCFNSRRGVCQAYCELFCYLADAVGVTSDIISGKTKNSQGVIPEEKHAWIFVYTHGYEGMLLDPTWGAGSVSGSRFIKSEENDTWFNVSPYWMIFSHFPDQQYWTKLDVELTEQQFARLPYFKPTITEDGKERLFDNLVEN